MSLCQGLPTLLFYLLVTLASVSGSGLNRQFGLPSLIVPIPCQADVLYEQLNYICYKNQIMCLPGWKVCTCIPIAGIN